MKEKKVAKTVKPLIKTKYSPTYITILLLCQQYASLLNTNIDSNKEKVIKKNITLKV